MFHRVAGLAPGNPDRSRRWTPPGPGGPKAARRPQGRAVPLAVPLVVSLMVSLVVSLRVGSGEGDRARPGFSGRSGVPSGGRMGPGDGSRRGWQAGGGAAASGPSSAISGITNGIISGITKGGGGGRRSSTPGFLRAAPWEKASLTSGSGERDQNPGNGSLCSRRHGRRQKTGAGTDGRGRAHPGGPRKPQAIASAPPSNGISNGISSGILWRASRMARAGEGTRRPWAMAPPSPPEGSRLARVCFPRPDPGVSGGFPRRSGIAPAMQSRGIHSRPARA